MKFLTTRYQYLYYLIIYHETIRNYSRFCPHIVQDPQRAVILLKGASTGQLIERRLILHIAMLTERIVSFTSFKMLLIGHPILPQISPTMQVVILKV